jgi:hypothetical protein
LPVPLRGKVGEAGFAVRRKNPLLRVLAALVSAEHVRQFLRAKVPTNVLARPVLGPFNESQPEATAQIIHLAAVRLRNAP